MTRSKKNNSFNLDEFLYRDKPLYLITFIGGIIIFALIFKYDFPGYLIYVFMFLMIGLSIYRYSLFIKSKNIKSIKTNEGVVVETGDKKWLEQKKFFQKVGIFLLAYYSLVGVFYLFTRLWTITQLFIFLGLLAWGWLIEKGIIIKK